MPAGPGNAGLPVLAATATGFEIGWIEQSSNTTKGVVCALDRQLVPMGRPSSLGTGGARVVLASSGIRVVAGYNGTLFDLAVDGTVVTTSPGLVSAESLVISPSRAIEAGQSVVESTFYCSPLSWYIFGCPNGMTPGMTAPVYNTSSMSLLDAGSGQITEYFNFPSNLGGAVDFDGESVLLVRYDGLPGYGGSVSGIRISPDAYGSKHFPPPSFALGTFPSQMRDSDAVPAIAHDGRQHLVVWQNGKAISGALINAGGRVTTLSIAQNGSLPNVIATAPGRFLVTYDLIDAAGRHLATRFIDVTSRRRAAS